MQLRKLLSEDASSFRDIRLRGLRECPSAFSSSYEEEVETPLQTIEGRLGLNKNGSVIGCIINNRVVGVVGIQREAHRKLSHKAIIWGMYVAPEHRRQGIGRKLVARALDYALTELNVLIVNLGVNTENKEALALYESVGFRTYGTERGFLQIDDKLYDEHLMTWTRESAA